MVSLKIRIACISEFQILNEKATFCLIYKKYWEDNFKNVVILLKQSVLEMI